MILLTVREWVGSKHTARVQSGPHIRLAGFVTRLPLGKAIESLYAYESAYKTRFEDMSVEFNLVAVATIDDLTDDQIAEARMELIEDMRVADERCPEEQ